MIEHDNGIVSANNRTYTSQEYARYLKQENERQEAARQERVKWHMLNEALNKNQAAFIAELEKPTKKAGALVEDRFYGWLLLAMMVLIGICS